MYYSLRKNSSIIVHHDDNATNVSLEGGYGSLSVSLNSGDIVISSTLQTQCGVYPIRINVVGEENYSMNKVIYIVDNYNVIEHVFANQIVKGFLTDRVESDVLLSVYVCTPASQPNLAIYERFEYKDEKGFALNVIQNISKTISNDPLEHISYSVTLSSFFPASVIFNDFSKDSFVFVRIVRANGDVLVDGILEINDGRFDYRNSYNVQTVKRKNINQTEESVFYTISAEEIRFEIYSAGSILSVFPVVDNLTESILYENDIVSINGKGLLDFMTRLVETINGGHQSIYKILEVFGKIIVLSVLGECGLYRGFGKTYFQGFGRLVAAFPNLRAGSSSVYLKYIDVIELFVEFLRFIISDTYGEGEQFNGELRSLTVEPTRGLRDKNGVFPNKEKELEFSFFKFDTAQEVINKITEDTHFLYVFLPKKSQTENFTHAYHYTIDTLFFRNIGDIEVFEENLTNFQVVSQNVLTIDKTVTAFNQIVGGEVAAQENITFSLEYRDSAFSYTASEINGAGNEFDGDTINDGFFDKIYDVKYNSNPVLSISQRDEKKEFKLLFATRRRNHTTLLNTQFLTPNVLRISPAIASFTPLYYTLNFSDRPRIKDYYAQAFIEFEKVKNEFSKNIIENITLTDINALSINNGTVLKTNLFNNTNEFKYYIIKRGTVDAIGNACTLTVQEVNIPSRANQVDANSSQCGIEYDIVRNLETSNNLPIHGVMVRKNFISPTVSNLSTCDDNTTFLNYTTNSSFYSSNVFQDDYEGWKLVFSNPSSSYSVKHYLNGKLQNSYTNPGSFFSSNSFLQNVLTTVGRHEFQVQTSAGIEQLRADVYSGALVTRDKGYLVYGVINNYNQEILGTYRLKKGKNFFLKSRVRYFGNVLLFESYLPYDEFFYHYPDFVQVYLTDKNEVFIGTKLTAASKFVIPKKRNTVFDIEILIVNGSEICKVDNVTLTRQTVSSPTFPITPNFDTLPKVGYIYDDKSFVAIDYLKFVSIDRTTSACETNIDISFQKIYQVFSNMKDLSIQDDSVCNLTRYDGSSYVSVTTGNPVPEIGIIKNDAMFQNQKT